MQRIYTFGKEKGSENPLIRIETNELRFQQGRYMPLMMHETSLLREIMKKRVALRAMFKCTYEAHKTLEDLNFMRNIRAEYSVDPVWAEKRARYGAIEFAGTGLLADILEQKNLLMGDTSGSINANHILEETKQTLRHQDVEPQISDILHNILTDEDIYQTRFSSMNVLRYARKRFKFLLTAHD